MAGKLLVGQSGGATAVINASLIAVIEEAVGGGRFEDVWGMTRGTEGALQGDFVDLTPLSQDRLRRIAVTPGAALGSSRHKPSDDEISQLLDNLKRLDIRAFVLIGGNDSADSTHRLAGAARDAGYDLSAIAVPKTIDNDLPETDHCPGYGSIARYVAVAAMDSAKDTESMPTMYPIKVIEVMGRDAGWVAAAATLGKHCPEDAPHLTYVPERGISRAQLLEDVGRIHQQLGRVVMVVPETLRDEKGQPFADEKQSRDVDAFGHRLLRGTADTMCRIIQDELGLRSRFDKPGSLQRMSMLCVSGVDLSEAALVGRSAVRLAQEGATDRMVTLQRRTSEDNGDYAVDVDSASLARIANQQKLLPPEFLRTDGEDTTPAFRQYALPLLGQGPLPTYERLDAKTVV